MSMKKNIILICITVFIIISCSKTNTLSKKDFEWMPYKGTETLVFNSNAGDIDTFFFLKKDTLIAYPEAQYVNGTKYEMVSIFCKHTDAWTPDRKLRYLESSFLELSKAKDNHAELNVLLSAQDATFYKIKPLKIDSLNIQKPSVLQTKYKDYDDVYIINTEVSPKYSNRSDYVTKVYWSKTQGLIRYDKKDSTYWELAQVL